MPESLQVNEFEFTNADFQRVRKLVKDRSGIDLQEGKRALVYGRLARRLRQLGLASFADYLPLVEAGDDEAVRFINALTTNVTEFFREAHHMQFLVERTVPEAIARVGRGAREPRRLRIWSAGCSTGEEPYSIAISLLEIKAKLVGWDVKILATDLDSDALATAAAGRYGSDRVAKIGAARLGRWFRSVPDGERASERGRYEIASEARAMVTFKQLNLLGQWPMQGPFDAIFCRNVIIYFDDETKQGLVRRYRRMLRPEGYLFLGHSESLVGSGLGFLPCGRTVYRPEGAAAKPAGPAA
jgi:chemotaxis protein methyltransferase CheR